MRNEEFQSGEFINQGLIKDSKIISIKNIDQKPICKIIASDQVGSGTFIEWKKINKPFYCLLTAAHVIKNEKGKIIKDIEVLYNNENDCLTINLNENERFFRDYSFMGIDAFLIQIISKDDILDKSFFLKPNLDFINKIEKLENQKIIILHYPLGKELSISSNTIKKVNAYSYEIYHTASTEYGSSGSPILLLDSKKVNWNTYKNSQRWDV